MMYSSFLVVIQHRHLFGSGKLLEFDLKEKKPLSILHLCSIVTCLKDLAVFKKQVNAYTAQFLNLVSLQLFTVMEENRSKANTMADHLQVVH